MDTAESKGCDPCQVPDKKTKTICGWQGRSLSMHLKVHKKATGATLKLKEYRERFPSFSIGPPAYIPPSEQVKKFRAASSVIQKGVQNAEQRIRDASNRDRQADRSRKQEEARIEERFTELWGMVELDPAAKSFAMSAARDESILEELYQRTKKIRDNPLTKEYDKLKSLNADYKEVQDRLSKTMTSLSLTVDQRRKSNQLGSDTVSQLICNFANTVRKMGPEKQEAFGRRCSAVRKTIQERVRVNVLSLVDDGFDQDVKVENDHDYRKAIAKFGEKAK
jgi:hypothetical protein